MLGTNINKAGWPKCGEIDIMENVGFDPDGVHTTVHTGKYNHVKKTAKGHRETIAKPYDDFHVYAIEWDAKKIDFFIDEKKVFSFADDGGGEDAWPFNHDHYLLLNFAIGGGWGAVKGVDESIWPQKYYIDYVRVYQRP
jgi:beta-glucanase (GH16 family)